MSGSSILKGESSERIVPAWSYRPGPDVAIVPPRGMVEAQALAKAAVSAALAFASPGVTERDVERTAGGVMRAGGAERVWTISNVGLGANARICFPTHPPTDLAALERDVLMVDVHPITSAGFWGDCTRCRVIGSFPDAQQALDDLEALHREVLGLCRPGMRANELFGQCSERLKAEGFQLLDLLANVGHSLSAGAAYVDGFLDASNETALWGSWALEPFAARGDIAVKVEDVVWFGREHCTVL